MAKQTPFIYIFPPSRLLGAAQHTTMLVHIRSFQVAVGPINQDLLPRAIFLSKSGKWDGCDKVHWTRACWQVCPSLHKQLVATLAGCSWRLPVPKTACSTLLEEGLAEWPQPSVGHLISRNAVFFRVGSVGVSNQICFPTNLLVQGEEENSALQINLASKDHQQKKKNNSLAG